MTIQTNIKLDEFERFCIRSGWYLKSKTKTMTTYAAGRSEIVVTKDDEGDDIIYVTQPWKSADWRQLYPVAAAIKERFGGKVTGDGFSGTRFPTRDEWESKFKLDSGER